MRMGDFLTLLRMAGLPPEPRPVRQPQRFPVREIPRFQRSAPEVIARLERMNPQGAEEGYLLRGWHPHDRAQSYERQTMSPREFVARFGRPAYDALQRKDIIRRGHRKGVALTAVHRASVA